MSNLTNDMMYKIKLFLMQRGQWKEWTGEICKPGELYDISWHDASDNVNQRSSWGAFFCNVLVSVC